MRDLDLLLKIDSQGGNALSEKPRWRGLVQT